MAQISDTNFRGNSTSTGRGKDILHFGHQRWISPSTVGNYLTTFWMPFDYLWMPFGICSARREFQRRMHLIVKGLPGIAVIADDILVYGCGPDYCADHNANLRRLLQPARDSNLKLNRKKLQLGLEEVTYIGRLLTNKGLRPDLMKVQAIQALPQATNKSQ